jgi:hypothetical protein
MGYTDAVKLGNKLVLTRMRYGDVMLASTSDNGKTWSTVTWTLGTGSSLTTIDGKAGLVLGQSLYSMFTAPTSLMTFDSLTNDPPEPVKIDLPKLQVGEKSFTACTPKTRGGLRVELANSRERRAVMVTLAPEKDAKDAKDKKPAYLPPPLRMITQISRVDSAGNGCTDAVLAGQLYGSSEYVTIAPHELGKGWILRHKSGSDSSKLEARSLSCKVE